MEHKGVAAVPSDQPESYVKKQQYKFEKTLGKGTYGVVRSATRTLPDNSVQRVAVKIITKNVLKGQEQLVMQEIEMVRSLDHPHIVKLLDWFESKDKYYLVFEEASGGELFDRLMHGRFTERAACRIIRVVLEAIVYMHAHNTVHRDIKPENILYRSMAEDANIVLVDFGIATHLQEHAGKELHGLCGSVGYAAPEVVAHKGYGKPVDMWGLGIVTYCMLCGFAPFSSADPALFQHQIQSEDVSLEGKYWDSVSADGIDFVRQCLKRDPDARISAPDALHHPWLRLVADDTSHAWGDYDDGSDIGAGMRENYRTKWKSAMATVRATKRLQMLGGTNAQHASGFAAPEPPTSPLYSDEEPEWNVGTQYDDDTQDGGSDDDGGDDAGHRGWFAWLMSLLPHVHM